MCIEQIAPFWSRNGRVKERRYVHAVFSCPYDSCSVCRVARASRTDTSAQRCPSICSAASASKEPPTIGKRRWRPGKAICLLGRGQVPAWVLAVQRGTLLAGPPGLCTYKIYIWDPLCGGAVVLADRRVFFFAIAAWLNLFLS